VEDRRDIPFGVIARQWVAQRVVPFLGASASVAGMDEGCKAILDARGFAAMLIREAAYPGDSSDPLTKVAQYTEDRAAGRFGLLEYVSREFNEVLDDPGSGITLPYRCALTRFLETIPMTLPQLVLTTNYDTIIERTLDQPAFREQGVRYVAVSHVIRGNQEFGQLLCYDSLDGDPLKLIPSEFDASLLPGGRYADHVVIYKMHGTSRHTGTPGSDDSIVLTETDYVNFMADDLLGRIPETIISKLRSSHLLFLGYSLEDWNFRVFLQRLRKLDLQSPQRPHWACRLFDENSRSGQVEKMFWEKRNVILYNLDLSVFLDALGLFIVGRTR